MKKLQIILVFGLVSLGSFGIVQAKDPFVYISFDRKEVNLGTSLIWDTIIPEALTLKVNSNCLHGSVVASMSSMKNFAGREIKPDRVFIQTPFTGGFVSMARPVVISEPAFGSHNIVIDFKVKANGIYDRAGDYIGTIAFTVMPPV